MISYLPSSLFEPYKKDVAAGFVPYKGESSFVIKNIILKYTWSPIVFKNFYRHEKNFISSEYIALDFDEGVTIAEVLNHFIDVWHIIGTTKSHQKWKGTKPPCDRFRLLLKATRPTECLREYKHTMSCFISNYRADGACKDGARLFYPCDKIVSENLEEDCYYEEWKTPPSEEEDLLKKEKFEAYTKTQITHGIMPTYTRRWLTQVMPQGMRSVACYVMGKELCMCGISYEDALTRILSSPTYKDILISPETLKKIKSQVSAGYAEIQKTMGA